MTEENKNAAEVKGLKKRRRKQNKNEVFTCARLAIVPNSSRFHRQMLI